jgi:alpha-galactosidase
LLSTVITIGRPSETHGEARAFSLVYSGNFLFEAEIGEMGRLRVVMGINPRVFAWHLDTGK